MAFSSIRNSGKTNFLCRDQLGRGMGCTSCVDVNPQAHEDAPSFAAPLAVKNNKGVFCNQSGRLTTLDDTFEPLTCACCHFQCWSEVPHSRFELAMGEVHRNNKQRTVTRVVYLPENLPTSLRHISCRGDLLQRNARLRFRSHQPSLFEPTRAAQFLAGWSKKCSGRFWSMTVAR